LGISSNGNVLCAIPKNDLLEKKVILVSCYAEDGATW